MDDGAHVPAGSTKAGKRLRRARAIPGRPPRSRQQTVLGPHPHHHADSADASALGAEGIAGGERTFAYRLQTLNETIIDASWGLGIAALAVAGGLSRTLGNRFTLPLGLVGGLAFALASGTIAYTDRFDGLFPLASLLALWGVVVGLLLLARRAD